MQDSRSDSAFRMLKMLWEGSLNQSESRFPPICIDSLDKLWLDHGFYLAFKIGQNANLCKLIGYLSFARPKLTPSALLTTQPMVWRNEKLVFASKTTMELAKAWVCHSWTIFLKFVEWTSNTTVVFQRVLRGYHWYWDFRIFTQDFFPRLVLRESYRRNKVWSTTAAVDLSILTHFW